MSHACRSRVPHIVTLNVILLSSRPPSWRLLLTLALLLSAALPARAHVGNKDVFEQVDAGPYRLFVTIRPPIVIPGVATIEVRASGPVINTLSITPVPLTGEAARHPPTADTMHRSAVDPAFFTGSLWLMAPGSWQVRFAVTGAAGPATAGVPVPAMPLSVLRVQRPLGLALAALGLLLVVGIVGIIAAAVRESRLPPGAAPDPARRRRALVAGAGATAVVALLLWAGDTWWNVEAAAYASAVYQPLTLEPILTGNTLNLHIRPYTAGVGRERASRSNTDLIPDHGQLMHLYAIRFPTMDAVFHLHPHLVDPHEGDLQLALPAMPPGRYRLFADIVHANGFPETLTTTLTIPSSLPAAPLAPDDASAAPPPLAAGDLGSAYCLPDGYTMVWDRPGPPAGSQPQAVSPQPLTAGPQPLTASPQPLTAGPQSPDAGPQPRAVAAQMPLTANTAYLFRFRLLDPIGRPAAHVEPYLGMAGHAAFVKSDGSAFAHTHPDGSAAMPAMMLANATNSDATPTSSMPGMAEANPAPASQPAPPLPPEVAFPYGFPTPGRYRIVIQMKHSGTVETGVFDAEVH